MKAQAVRPSRMRLWALVAIIFIAAAAAAIAIAGFWRFSSPSMTRRVEAAVARQVNGRCTLGHLAVVPFRGFSCTGLVVARTLADSSGIELRLPRLDVTYRPPALLVRLPALIRFGAEFLAAQRTIGDATGLSHERKTLSETMTAFSRSLLGEVLKRVVVSEASLAVTKDRTTVISVAGIKLCADMIVRDAPVLAVEAEAQSFDACFPWHAEKITAVASIEGGTLRLARISARMYGGRVSAYGGINVDRRRLDSLYIRANRIDIGEIYQASGKPQGRLSGRGRLNLTFEPCALGMDSLRAKGDATVTEVVVSDHPIQNLLLTNLLIPSVARLTFDKVTSRVTVEEGAVYTADLRARGDPLSLASNGWMSFVGKLDYAVEGTLTKDFVHALPPVVRESLLPARGGGASFTCRIYGSVDDPAMSVDKKHVDRAVNSVIKSISKELQKFFR